MPELRRVPTTDSATWWPTPEAASASRMLRVDREERPGRGLVELAGVRDVHHDRGADEDVREPLSGQGVDPRGGGAGHRLVPLAAQVGHDLRSDEAGSADDDDLHDGSSEVSWGRLLAVSTLVPAAGSARR